MSISNQATRRGFVQGMASLAAFAAVETGKSNAAASALGAPAKRPNILFLFTEGQRADALSFHGNNPFAHTPNMDRIAQEGVSFNNAFVTNALCAPSRTVALTGLNSHSSGILGNAVKGPLSHNIPIVTEILHDAGYDVAMVGKAHGPLGYCPDAARTGRHSCAQAIRGQELCKTCHGRG